MTNYTKESLKLYRSLLRASATLPIYNFRVCAKERIRYSFRQNRQLSNALTPPETIEKYLKEGNEQLELIKRQASIQKMFGTSDKLVVE